MKYTRQVTAVFHKCTILIRYRATIS